MPQPQPSSALISQVLSKNVMEAVIRIMEPNLYERFIYRYNMDELEIEFWANGIWIKQLGIISYDSAAEIIQEISSSKAIALEVIEKGPRLKLVEGSQKSYYAVVENNGEYKCECMLYKCRANRLEEEFPELYRALDEQVFCHHTVAAGQDI